MGKLSEFQIRFENSSEVFYTEAIIRGQVFIQLEKVMMMRGIRVRFEGSGRVSWTETLNNGTSDKRQKRTKDFRADEIYLDEKLLLFGNWPRETSNSQELPVGSHIFPFEFQLPKAIPSSFEAKYGRVRYFVTATIDKPWKFDHEVKRLFTVIQPLDLNNEPYASRSHEDQQLKTLCCLCCESGPIRAMLRVHRGGFVPGENLDVSAEVINNSDTEIACSKLFFIQEIIFHAQGKKRKIPRTVLTVRHGAVDPGDTDVWLGEQIRIPALPPSRLDGCKLIDISYCAKFVVQPSFLSINLKIPIDVLIGTIPLHSVVEEYQNQQSSQMEAAHPLQTLAQRSVTALPAPIYEECIFGKVNVRDVGESVHVRGDKDFAPVYPCYNWKTTLGSLGLN